MKPDVWAPRADLVEVVLVDGSRHRLTKRDDGWHVGGPELAPGEEYRFSLDGGEPLPDPRSHSQPDGIEGPSAPVDHGAFPWTDHGWRGFHLPGSVLYELHVGTFTPEGDFDAAILRLDHLEALGVDCVEVMPVAEAMGERGWGYDGVLLYAPHHAYGGPDAFKRFVDACHHRGIGVILDVVYNHLGPKGNHLEQFGPYFTEEHHTPWGAAVNLDGEGAAEVRRFIVDNARHWFIDHHVDGLRLDATHALVDDSPVHLLAQLSEEVEHLSAHLGRRLWLVAEDERDDPDLVLPREAGGIGLDGRWADDLHHAIHVAITGETQGYYGKYEGFDRIAAALTGVHGKPGVDPVPDTVPSHRFIVCTQNHDQVGNRAVGERLSHLAGPDAQIAAAALVLCSPGTPMLFMGEEWAASTPFPYFVDVPDDPDLAAAITKGRRAEFAEFGWEPEQIPDPTDPATFEMAKLDWDERDDGVHAEVLDVYRQLIALRRARPDLTDGRRDRTSVEVDEEKGVVVVRREATVVQVELGPPARVTILTREGGTWVPVLRTG
jgi:maltooligosyltrehalose trehalohydrolase